MNYVISILSAIIGGLLVIFYNQNVSKRQEKAIILLFSYEFITLFNRCSMYYSQMLKSGISYSRLCEVSDSATMTKLTELTSNQQIIKTIIDLKTWFFQVIKYTDRTSEEIALGNEDKANKYQQLAIVFFMGDVLVEGKYDRQRFKKYIENIQLILDYLSELNSPSAFETLLIHFFSAVKKRYFAVNQFISKSRQQLNERQEELEELRAIEKSRIGQGAPTTTES